MNIDEHLCVIPNNIRSQLLGNEKSNLKMYRTINEVVFWVCVGREVVEHPRLQSVVNRIPEPSAAGMFTYTRSLRYAGWVCIKVRKWGAVCVYIENVFILFFFAVVFTTGRDQCAGYNATDRVITYILLPSVFLLLFWLLLYRCIRHTCPT